MVVKVDVMELGMRSHREACHRRKQRFLGSILLLNAIQNVGSSYRPERKIS